MNNSQKSSMGGLNATDLRERFKVVSEANQVHKDEMWRWRDRAQALEAALDDYRLWRPCEKGHAAAHRRLFEVRDAA